MTLRFRARVVGVDVDPENRSPSAGFAERDDGGGFSVIFSCPLDSPTRSDCRRSVLVARIGWSRIQLRDHTSLHVVLGALVGAVVATAVFRPLR